MTKASPKNKHQQQTTKMGGSLLRLRAEDEPTTLKSSSMTSKSDRSSSRFVGCRGDSPGLSAVASMSERRGFVSASEQLPRTAERPGVARLGRASPWHPQAGAGKQLKKQRTKQVGCTGPDSCPDTCPVHPSAGSLRRAEPALFQFVVSVVCFANFSMVPVFWQMTHPIHFRNGRGLPKRSDSQWLVFLSVQLSRDC